MSLEESFRVRFLQFESIVVIEKIPPLLGERFGDECCVKQGQSVCRDLAVEATANVFYLFLPHGDDVKCMMCRSSLDECVDCVVGGGVGVVKRR